MSFIEYLACGALFFIVSAVGLLTSTVDHRMKELHSDLSNLVSKIGEVVDAIKSIEKEG